jgi:hypothetical protein
MPWVRVDDAFYDHEKFGWAGPVGLAQYMAGLAWCNRNLTDGFIPESAARRLLDWQGIHWKAWEGELVAGCETVDPIEVSDHLVSCGLWENAAGGYQIHDYLDYQPSADDVRAERARNAERQKKWRDSKRNADSNGATNETVTSAPNPNPNPNPNPDVFQTSNTPPPPSSSVARESKSEVEGIINEVRELRPEWSKASIRKALTDPAVQERPAAIVHAAMLAIARDPDSKLPGRLRNDGPWWQIARSAVLAPVNALPDWCGFCQSDSYRYFETDDGRVYPCQVCHPKAKSA